MSKISSLLLLAVLAGTATVHAEEPAGINELILNLRSQDEFHREQAAEKLARLGPAAAPAVRALTSALADRSEKVRNSALLALRRIGRGAHEAVPELMEILNSDDKSLFAGAIDLLGEIGTASSEAKVVLEGFMLGEDPHLSILACRALLRILPADDEDRPLTIPILIDAFKSDSEPVRNAATAALGSAGPIAVPELIELVEDHATDSESAGYAAAALAQMGPAAAPAVTALVLALQSSKEPVVVQAALTLGAIGPDAKAAAPNLKKLLSAKPAPIRGAALRALGNIGSDAAVVDIATALGDRDERVRFEAASALGTIGPEAKAAIANLISALGDESERVRWRAGWALGRIGAKTVSALTAVLEDEQQRTLAVAALGDIGPAARPAVPKLVELLSQDHLPKSLATEIIKTISHIGPGAGEAVPILLKIFDDEESELRPDAAWALAQIGVTEAVPRFFREMTRSEPTDSDLASVLPMAVLILNPANDAIYNVARKRATSLLEHESSLVKQMAAGALASSGKRAAPAVPQLTAGLEDPDPEVRGAFLATLAAIGPDAEESLPGVIKALADPVYPVRYSASYTVGRIGTAAKVTAPLLEQNLQDQDPLLRFASAWALVQVEPQRPDLAPLCLESFRWGLKYPNPRIRMEAAQALGKLGPNAASAMPDLEAAAKEADPIFRAAAEEALRQIQDQSEKPRGFFDRVRSPRAGTGK
jgi:HEAT repeat protein